MSDEIRRNEGYLPERNGGELDQQTRVYIDEVNTELHRRLAALEAEVGELRSELDALKNMLAR